MLRLSRLADYGVVLMTHVAQTPGRLHNAHELAAISRLPVPTVSKILKALARADLLESHRGAKGGYSLARRPEDVSVGEIIIAVEGPISLTVCIEGEGESCGCEFESICPTRGNWQRINDAIRRALDGVTLAEMAAPPAFLSIAVPRRAAPADRP
jgi:FeS assembly SUF system regulator